MSAENFNAEAGCVVLHEHKTDGTGKPRIIFLNTEVCELLKEQTKLFPTGALLRSNKGKAWTQRNITQAMRRLKRKAKVNAIAYGYRHSFATDALANGVPDATVAALLGHSSTAMLHKHYSHLTARADVLRKAASMVR
jgi:integrase